MATKKTAGKEDLLRGPDKVATTGGGADDAGETTPIPVSNDDYDGFWGLSDMNADERYPKWRNTLTTEDLMVAAMMKRFLYEGEAVTNFAAYHGLRDAMGVLISRVRDKEESVAVQIDKYYSAADDGSGDETKQMPPAPNP